MSAKRNDPNMLTQLATRVVLKAKKIARDLSPTERKFQKIWPMVEPIEGWLIDGQEKWLFEQALALPDSANLVEIGSYKGRSSCCLGFACVGTQKKVFAVDSFDGGADLPRNNSLPDFQLNVERCGLADYVKPIVGLSAEVSKTWDKPIHFLFIDGSHLYEDVMTDFNGFFPHVVPGGLVAFHDVHESHPGVLKAWTETFVGQLTDVGFYSTIGYGRRRLSSQ